jgi:hypothetical protein
MIPAGVVIMDKPKGKRPKGRPAKAREENTRAIAFRVTEEYAEWLNRAARADRVTIAGFLDRAAADRAKAIGFNEPPPERVP